MIIHEVQTCNSPESDRGRWLYRWTCSACEGCGSWLFDEKTSRRNGEFHAVKHGEEVSA